MKSIMLTVLVIGCVAVTCAASDGHDILLISGATDTVIPQPIVIWRLLPSPTATLERICAIDPEDGICWASGFPNDNLFIVWGDSKGGDVQGQNGYVKVFHLEHLNAPCRIDLPFIPSLGGYLFKNDKTGSFSVATLDPEGKGKVYLSQVRNAVSKIVMQKDVKWDDVRMYGTNTQRSLGKPLDKSLLIKLQPSGQWLYDFGAIRPKSGQEVRASLLNEQKMDLSWGGVCARNDRVRVLTIGSKPESDNWRYWFVHNIRTKEWDHLDGFGFRTETQLFGEWLLLNEGFCDYTAKEHSTHVSGKFTFYNTITKQTFGAELGADAEVLLIGDNGAMYYRRGDELFQGKLADNGIVDENSIVSANSVKDIHWAFVVKGDNESRPMIVVSIESPEGRDADDRLLILTDATTKSPVGVVVNGHIRVPSGKYNVYETIGQTLKMIGTVKVLASPASQTVEVKPEMPNSARWFFYSPEERLTEVKAGKGTPIRYCDWYRPCCEKPTNAG